MALIKTTNGHMRSFIKEMRNIVLVSFGFLAVFFMAQAKPFTGILSQDGPIGIDIAHADAPAGDSGAASSSGDGSGSGGCSGSGGSGGSDSGDGGCGCGGSC